MYTVITSTTELPSQLWHLQLIPSLLTGCFSQLLLLRFKTDIDKWSPQKARELGSSSAQGWSLHLVDYTSPEGLHPSVPWQEHQSLPGVGISSTPFSHSHGKD